MKSIVRGALGTLAAFTAAGAFADYKVEMNSDPKKTHKHEGPDGSGHLGDLPVLKVDAHGNATQPVTAPHLALRELRGKSLMVHEGGDNFSDQPKPNGGGGTRIACGVIQN